MCSTNPFANRTGTDVIFPIRLVPPPQSSVEKLRQPGAPSPPQWWRWWRHGDQPHSAFASQSQLSSQPLALHRAVSLPFPGYILRSGVDMQQPFLQPCPFASLKRINPEGQWCAGFPAEPQMCLGGASLEGPPGWGGSCSQHRRVFTMLGEGLSLAGKRLLMSS